MFVTACPGSGGRGEYIYYIYTVVFNYIPPWGSRRSTYLGWLGDQCVCGCAWVCVCLCAHCQKKANCSVNIYLAVVVVQLRYTHANFCYNSLFGSVFLALHYKQQLCLTFYHLVQLSTTYMQPSATYCTVLGTIYHYVYKFLLAIIYHLLPIVYHLLTTIQGWALRSFPFGTLRSFPF